jgi:hypothetical protein
MEVTVAEKQERLFACRKIRTLASVTCLYTFHHVNKLSHKVSEEFFSNFWNKELERSFLKGYIDSWYDPPPGGIGVIFANINDLTRFNYESLRPNTSWPKMKSYFQKEGLGYLFSSPYTMVNDVPIIGDFRMTYYLGKDETIRNHFRKSFKILLEILEKISVGMTFSEIFRLSQEIITKNGLINNIFAVTDQAITNFGHTIPFIDSNPTNVELVNIKSGDPQKINSTISHARRFINNLEDYLIAENCAFTYEPRFINIDKSLPMFSFHQIVSFVGGKKFISDNFRGLINYFNMNWIYE